MYTFPTVHTKCHKVFLITSVVEAQNRQKGCMYTYQQNFLIISITNFTNNEKICDMWHMSHSTTHPGLIKQQVNFTFTLHFRTHTAHHQNKKKNKKLCSKRQYCL